MSQNLALKTLSFDLFIVIENMNDNNQVPD